MKNTLIDTKTLQRAAGTLRVLAHPVRLRIIENLKTRRQSVGELTASLGCPQAIVSKHLALLRKAGLLTSETQANFRHYSLASTHVLDVLNCIKRNCPKEV